jgi:hypothetical protein
MEPQVVCIFCDDIREDTRNTDIIVGIFPDNLAAPKLPATLSRFSIYTRLHLPVDNETKQIVLNLETTSKDRVLIGEIKERDIAKAKDNAKSFGLPYAGILIKARMSPFVIAKPGLIRAIVEMDGTETLGGILNIIDQSNGATEDEERYKRLMTDWE